MTRLGLLGWVATLVAVVLMLRIGWEVVRDPWRVLDLSTHAGEPDHGKRVGLFQFVALYILAWGYLLIQHDLHWMIWSLLAVLPYGLIGLRIYFGARRQTVEPPEKPLPQTEPRAAGEPDGGAITEDGGQG